MTGLTTSQNATAPKRTYPAREAVLHGDRSYFYSEGLAVCTEKAYNGEAEKYPFISFVIDELRKSLS